VCAAPINILVPIITVKDITFLGCAAFTIDRLEEVDVPAVDPVVLRLVVVEVEDVEPVVLVELVVEDVVELEDEVEEEDEEVEPAREVVVATPDNEGDKTGGGEVGVAIVNVAPSY